MISTMFGGLSRRGLYLITPDLVDTAVLVARLRVALGGRPALVQYRNKVLQGDAATEQAAQVVALCREAGVQCVVNDCVERALAVDADGVHLGRHDGDLSGVRRRIGSGRMLGVSCYDDFGRAEDAVAVGADYVAFGAMFPSRTKPDAVAAPVPLLTRARELGVAVAAIGGITLDNAAPLVDAGADLLAVISDVFEATDPAARAAGYRALYD